MNRWSLGFESLAFLQIIMECTRVGSRDKIVNLEGESLIAGSSPAAPAHYCITVCAILYNSMNDTIEKECRYHGLTTFVQESGGKRYFRCRACRVKAVEKRRRKVRRELVEYKGGKCLDCGYQHEYPGVYDFHHRDESTKSFGLSQRGLTRSIKSMFKEADKCDLLCANCHRLRHRTIIKED